VGANASLQVIAHGFNGARLLSTRPAPTMGFP
jgi:hypothetical protein